MKIFRKRPMTKCGASLPKQIIAKLPSRPNER
jgi:hypothetical protein